MWFTPCGSSAVRKNQGGYRWTDLLFDIHISRSVFHNAFTYLIYFGTIITRPKLYFAIILYVNACF